MCDPSPSSTIFNHLQHLFWIIVEWAKAGGAGLGHVYHLTSLEAARRTGELGLMILMAKGNHPKWLCVQCRSNMIPQYTSCLTRSATWTCSCPLLIYQEHSSRKCSTDGRDRWIAISVFPLCSHSSRFIGVGSKKCCCGPAVDVHPNWHVLRCFMLIRRRYRLDVYTIVMISID